MNRKLRTLLIVVAVLIVVLVVTPFLIPINQFRPTIEEEASTALGRKVTLGNLSLSIISGSLSAEELSIGDDPRFSSSPFLTAKSLKVGVELVPLIFSKTLNITGVAVETPEVTLLRNSAGQWNYSSLGGPAAKSAPRETATASKSSGSSSSFSVSKFELKNGQVTVGMTNSPKRSRYDHVEISASDFSMTSQFAFKATANLPGGGKFQIDGRAGPIDSADTSLTPLEAKLKVSSLDLASSGFFDPSLGLGGVADLDAQLSSQHGTAETKGTARVSKALLVAGGSHAPQPLTLDFNTKYDLRKSAGVFEPSTLKVGNAAAELGGTYQTAGEATVVNLKLQGQNMPVKDLQSFLPAVGINLPKGATLEAGSLSTNLNASGPTNRLVMSGNVGLFSAKLAGFDLGSKMAAISSLAGIQTGKDLDIEKLTSEVRMAPDGITAQNFIAVLPSLGQLMGGGTVDAKNNLDFKMTAVLTNGAGAAGTPASSGIAMLTKLTGGSGCKGMAVPFRIQGTTSNPRFIPDVGAVVSGLLKSQLGCNGAGSGATSTQSPANAVTGILGLLQKKKK